MSLHIKQDNTIYLSNILDGIPHLKTDKNGNRYFYFYDRYKKGFIDKPRIELDIDNISQTLRTAGYNVKSIYDLNYYLPPNLKILDEISYGQFLCNDGTIITNEYFDTFNGYSIGIPNVYKNSNDYIIITNQRKSTKKYKSYANIPNYLRDNGLELSINMLSDYAKNNLKNTLLSKIKTNNTVIILKDYQTTLPNPKKTYRNIYSWALQSNIYLETDKNNTYVANKNKHDEYLFKITKKQLIWLFDNNIPLTTKITIENKTYNVIDIYNWYHKYNVINIKNIQKKYKNIHSRYSVTSIFPIKPWVSASNNKYYLSNLFKRQLNLMFIELHEKYNLPKHSFSIPKQFNNFNNKNYQHKLPNGDSIDIPIEQILNITKRRILGASQKSLKSLYNIDIPFKEFRHWGFNTIIQKINDYQHEYAPVFNKILKTNISHTLNQTDIDYIQTTYQPYIDRLTTIQNQETKQKHLSQLNATNKQIYYIKNKYNITSLKEIENYITAQSKQKINTQQKYAFAEKYQIPISYINKKLKQQKSFDQILNEYKKYKNRVIQMRTDHNGTVYSTITKLCNHYGIKEATYRRRLEKGLSKKEALTKPIGD